MGALLPRLCCVVDRSPPACACCPIRAAINQLQPSHPASPCNAAPSRRLPAPHRRHPGAVMPLHAGLCMHSLHRGPPVLDNTVRDACTRCIGQPLLDHSVHDAYQHRLLFCLLLQSQAPATLTPAQVGVCCRAKAAQVVPGLCRAMGPVPELPQANPL